MPIYLISMATEKSSVILLLIAVFVNSTKDRQGLFKHLPQISAAEECKARGTSLLEYSDLKNYSAHELIDFLNDGQSAWIEGSVIFSPFLNWIGCFINHESLRENSFDKKFSLNNRSLYFCQRKCTNGFISYVGVSDRTCFCFQRLPYTLLKVYSSMCDLKCSNYSFESCGGNHTVSLYRKQLYTIETIPYPNQCMYMTVTEARGLVKNATSCLAQPTNPKAAKYVCMKQTKKTCGNYETILHDYCPVIEESSTWLNASVNCQFYNGQLLFSTIYSYEVQSALSTVDFGTSLWLGAYRTFAPTHKNDSNRDKNACLAATRIGYSFYVETDICSENKLFICKPFHNDSNIIRTTVTGGTGYSTTQRTPENIKSEAYPVTLHTGGATHLMTSGINLTTDSVITSDSAIVLDETSEVQSSTTAFSNSKVSTEFNLSVGPELKTKFDQTALMKSDGTVTDAVIIACSFQVVLIVLLYITYRSWKRRRRQAVPIILNDENVPLQHSRNSRLQTDTISPAPAVSDISFDGYELISEGGENVIVDEKTSSGDSNHAYEDLPVRDNENQSDYTALQIQESPVARS